MTDDFDDDALRNAIGSRSGGPVHIGTARQAVIARAQRTRTVRTGAIVGTTGLVVIAGLFLLPNIGDTQPEPADQPAAPTIAPPPTSDTATPIPSTTRPLTTTATTPPDGSSPALPPTTAASATSTTPAPQPNSAPTTQPASAPATSPSTTTATSVAPNTTLAPPDDDGCTRPERPAVHAAIRLDRRLHHRQLERHGVDPRLHDPRPWLRDRDRRPISRPHPRPIPQRQQRLADRSPRTRRTRRTHRQLIERTATGPARRAIRWRGHGSAVPVEHGAPAVPVALRDRDPFREELAGGRERLPDSIIDPFLHACPGELHHEAAVFEVDEAEKLAGCTGASPAHDRAFLDLRRIWIGNGVQPPIRTRSAATSAARLTTSR